MTQIIVVKLGWVLVGSVSEKDNTLVVKNASVIRQWGTTRGLGQLAADGPQKETKLDSCGHVIIEKSAVLFRIDCEPKSWPKI